MKITFENNSLRKCKVIKRRIYHASGPIQTLHSDGNNKPTHKIISVKTDKFQTELVD